MTSATPRALSVSTRCGCVRWGSGSESSSSTNRSAVAARRPQVRRAEGQRLGPRQRLGDVHVHVDESDAGLRLFVTCSLAPFSVACFQIADLGETKAPPAGQRASAARFAGDLIGE